MEKTTSSSHRKNKMKVLKITIKPKEIIKNRNIKIHYSQLKKTLSLKDDNAGPVNKNSEHIEKIKLLKNNLNLRNTNSQKSALSKNRSLILKKLKNKGNSNSIISQKMQDKFFARSYSSSYSLTKSMFFINPNTILKHLLSSSQYKEHYRLINHLNIKKKSNKGYIFDKFSLSKSISNNTKRHVSCSSIYFPKIYSYFNRNGDTLKTNTSSSIKNNLLEQKVRHRINTVKKILKKRAQNNSMVVCKSIEEIGNDLMPYEEIDNENAEKKIAKKIYYSKSNLNRLVHLIKVSKEGFDEDDVEHNIKKIRNFGKDYRNNSVDILKDSFLKSAKTGNFLQKTIRKFNMYNGKYFGIPV